MYRIKFIFFILLFTLKSAFIYAVNLPPPSEFEDIPGTLRSSYYRATVPAAGVSLQATTIVKADEVVIEGPLTTNGNGLIIDTRSLEFRPGGKIQGFSTMRLTKNLYIPVEARQGDTGCDACTNYMYEKIGWLLPFFKSWGSGDGGFGKKGHDGETGLIGLSGHQTPSPIIIFAATVIGTPVIEGIGQSGGQGSVGGKGGKGGNGGKGQKAKANHYTGEPAGRGGDSGQRGKGGMGGTGGTGGAGIPIVFLTSKMDEGSLVTHAIRSSPGAGGLGGPPGLPGDFGAPGTGGEGDAVFMKSYEKGPSGEVDESNPDPVDLGPGEQGKAGNAVSNSHSEYKPYTSNGTALVRGSIIQNYKYFEKLRAQINRGWFQYHWSRILKLLVEESISQLKRQVKSNKLAGESTATEGVDLFLSDLVENSRELGHELLGTWKQEFKDPLNAIENVTDAAIPREELLRVATPLMKGLQELDKDNSKLDIVFDQLSLSLDEVNSFSESSLDNAKNLCLKYIAELEKHSVDLLAKTTHFLIPICLGSPDLRDEAHVKDEFRVYSVYEPTSQDSLQYTEIKPKLIVPKNSLITLNGSHQKSRSFSLNSLVKVFDQLFGIQRAFAYFDVIFIDHQPISTDLLRKQMSDEAMTSPDSAIIGYKMISKEDAVAHLPFYLRVLASLAGK